MERPAAWSAAGGPRPRRAGVLASAALPPLLLALAGCAGPGPAPPPAAETLRVALRADPGEMDPLQSASALSRMVSGQIFEPLIEFDAALRPVPRLALEWRYEGGGRSWTFRLRPGVRWHGGRNLEAADVAATLRRALDPRTPSLDLKPLLAGAGPVEIVDRLRLRVPFDPPASDSLVPWRRLLILADGLPSPADSPAPLPRGTGPYRFVSRRSGEWILLERNPEWWGGSPPIRYVLFRIIPEALTVSQALELGEVDIAPARLADRERSRRPGAPFRVVEAEAPVVYVAIWNLRPPGTPFADARVRRALALAFDRRSFAERVRRGAARVAATLYPPLWRRGRPGVEPLPYDPPQAARLLDEAGWRDSDGDGWRERGGARLSIPLLYPLEDEIRRDAALLLQSDLARVGVEVKPERVDGVSLVRRLHDRDFVAALHAWRMDPDPRAYDFLHSSQARAGLNYGGTSDPVLDRLLEREIQAPDALARARAGVEIERRLREDAPLLFICFPVTLIGVNRRVQGFEVGPLGLLQGVPGPADWSLEER